MSPSYERRSLCFSRANDDDTISRRHTHIETLACHCLHSAMLGPSTFLKQKLSPFDVEGITLRARRLQFNKQQSALVPRGNDCHRRSNDADPDPNEGPSHAPLPMRSATRRTALRARGLRLAS